MRFWLICPKLVSLCLTLLSLFGVTLWRFPSFLQHSDQQRRVKGAHPPVEDPRGHLQQHPDSAAAQALPTTLRVLWLWVPQEHELLRAEQHAGLQHHHCGTGTGQIPSYHLSAKVRKRISERSVTRQDVDIRRCRNILITHLFKHRVPTCLFVQNLCKAITELQRCV